MKDESALKALTFAPGVVRTDATDEVIWRYDDLFHAAGHRAVVTSVKRSVLGQLQTIERYAVAKQIIQPSECLDLSMPMDWRGQKVLRWQVVWSTLLHLGVIISPPVPAAVLMDYWRDGINKKGVTITPSAHLAGRAFDIGGGKNGAEDEFAVCQAAAKEISQVSQVLLERENNCVHTTIKGSVLI